MRLTIFWEIRIWSAESSCSLNGIRRRKDEEHLSLVLNDKKELERITLFKVETIEIGLL
jgi:hypothetical protein